MSTARVWSLLLCTSFAACGGSNGDGRPVDGGTTDVDASLTDAGVEADAGAETDGEVVDSGSMRTALVRLDDGSPSVSNIPREVPDHEYAVFELSGPAEAGIELEQLTITRQGSGSIADFERIILRDDGGSAEAVAELGASSTDAVELVLGEGAFRASAGEPLRLSLAADVNAASDTENRFCIDSAADVRVVSLDTGEPLRVTGAFPVCGNPMTSSDIDAARLTYTVQYPSVADLTVGETDVTLIEVSVSNDDSEDVHVAELGFSLFSIPWDHVASPTLHVAGDALTISAAEHPTEEVLRLTLSDEHLIERGGTVVFELRGDIVDGACDVLNMDFDPQHSTATGSTYRFHAVWQIGAGSQLPFDRNIAGECS